MDIVTEVAEKIYLIAEHPEDSIRCFQAFFIATEKLTLIEPGPTTFVPKIVDGLHKLGYEPDSLSYIIPTHIHADHSGGTGYLAQLAPNATMIAHEKGARHLANPAKLIEGTKLSWGENYESEIGPIIPISKERIRAVREGDTVPLGERTLTVIHSPGHAKHHICLHDANNGDLFSGESLGMLLPDGSEMVLPISSPPVFEIDVALETYNRLKKLNPSTIFFSHFGVSHNANRCIQLVEENTRVWGDIVLQALQSGENRAQIIARFQDIMRKLQPDTADQYDQFAGWTTDGYTGYFIKKGVVSHNAG